MRAHVTVKKDGQIVAIRNFNSKADAMQYVAEVREAAPWLRIEIEWMGA